MADQRQQETQKKGVIDARKRADQREKAFGNTAIKVPDGTPLFVIKKEGIYKVDVLPYVTGEGNPFCSPGKRHFERTYWVHARIGAEGNSYCCLQKTFKKPCPICEDRARKARDPNADEDEIKALAPKERQLWNVVDLSDGKVKLWDISFHLFGKALDKKIRNSDEDEGYHLFANLDPDDGGKTLKITASEEKGGGYTYYDCSDIEFKKRETTYDDDILEKVLCLDELPKELKHEDLRKTYLQLEDEEPKKKKPVEDEEDETPPKKKKPKEEEEEEAPKKKKPAAADEDDDDAPPKKKKIKEEEEEEETPKKNLAEKYGIKIGMDVDHDEHGKCEVVKVSPDGTSVTVEDAEGDLHRSISPKELTPVVKKKPKEEEEEEEAPKKKKQDVPFDDEDAPKKKKPKDEEEEEEEPTPKKKKQKEEDEEEEAAPKKKKPVRDDDD